jgi:acetyl esterase/lipase
MQPLTRLSLPILTVLCTAPLAFSPAISPVISPARAQDVSGYPTMKFGATTARVEPNMKALLQTLASLGGKPIEKLSPGVARQQPLISDAVLALLKKRGLSLAPEPVGSARDRSININGRAIPVRVYRPSAVADGLVPVLVYAHGGGWVIGSIQDYDSSCRALSNATRAMVISVGYRYAPQNRFPSAHEGVYAVTQWMMKNANELGGDPGRVAIGGESAGGNIASAVCMMARDRGAPMPVHQLLVYPITQYGNFNTPSYRRFAEAKPLNRAMMRWFFRQYLPPSNRDSNPRYLDLIASDKRRLPPATIIAAEIDPLTSEGVSYANKLRGAGVPVRYKLFRGVTHEFFGTGAVVPTAREAVKFAAEGLNAAFASGGALSNPELGSPGR